MYEYLVPIGTQRQLLAKVTVVEYARNTPDFQVWCLFLIMSLKVVPVLFDSGIARGTRECMVRCRNNLFGAEIS